MFLPILLSNMLEVLEYLCRSTRSGIDVLRLILLLYSNMRALLYATVLVSTEIKRFTGHKGLPAIFQHKSKADFVWDCVITAARLAHFVTSFPKKLKNK